MKGSQVQLKESASLPCISIGPFSEGSKVLKNSNTNKTTSLLTSQKPEAHICINSGNCRPPLRGQVQIILEIELSPLTGTSAVGLEGGVTELPRSP